MQRNIYTKRTASTYPLLYVKTLNLLRIPSLVYALGALLLCTLVLGDPRVDPDPGAGRVFTQRPLLGISIYFSRSSS